MRRLLAATVVVAVAGSNVRADLHFAQPQVKLGQARSGLPLRHRFAFVNAGRGPVTVTDMRTSCGCLTPRLDQRVYQPGERGAVMLDVQTLTQPAGPNVWRIQVTTRDDRGEHTHDLELLADLITEVKVEPPKLAVYTETSLRHHVTVTDLRGPSPLPLSPPGGRGVGGRGGLKVTRALFASPHLGASVAAVAPASYRITVEVRASLPEGRHEDVLCIATDDPVYRELRVPVSVVKRSRQSVSAAPDRVELIVPQGQPAPSRVVLVRGGSGDQEVKVERVEADNPALRCRWAAGPGKMATLRVSVDHTRVKDTLTGTVRVHVSKPAAMVLKIPVICRTR